jgi:hypothetical protein
MSFRSVSLRNMLDRHGSEATLRVNSTAGSYDTTTGTITGGATTDYTVMAHPSDYTLDEMISNSVVKGSRKITLSTLDTCGEAIPAPQVDDTIIGIGDTVSIVRVQTIYSNGAVCYICHVSE